jgi:hypothetical protein
MHESVRSRITLQFHKAIFPHILLSHHASAAAYLRRLFLVVLRLLAVSPMQSSKFSCLLNLWGRPKPCSRTPEEGSAETSTGLRRRCRKVFQSTWQRRTQPLRRRKTPLTPHCTSVARDVRGRSAGRAGAVTERRSQLIIHGFSSLSRIHSFIPATIAPSGPAVRIAFLILLTRPIVLGHWWIRPSVT